MQIQLHKLRFFAYHGVHDEEKNLGGEFEVNVSVFFELHHLPITQISQTIDYAELYAIIKMNMEEPQLLLETLVCKIAAQIIEQFMMADEVTVSVLKLHPVITDFEGFVSLTHTQKR